jgi:hypothetical protein
VVTDFSSFVSQAKAVGAVAICATDLLALTVLPNAASVGFEIAIGMIVLVFFHFVLVWFASLSPRLTCR